MLIILVVVFIYFLSLVGGVILGVMDEVRVLNFLIVYLGFVEVGEVLF